MPNTPEGWTQKTLGDFLTTEQLDRLGQIYDRCNGDFTEMTGICRLWFTEPEMAAQLESKGLDPAYASYALPFYYAQARQGSSEQQEVQETEDLVERILGQKRSTGGQKPPA